MTYRLDLIPVGDMIVPGSEVFWMRHFKEDYDLTLWVGVIRGEGRIVLVNTGCTEAMGELYEMTNMPKGGVVASLHSIGVRAEDVTDVVITPFQVYAIGNVTEFPNATIHLSRRGWIDFHAPRWRKHPHDIRERCIPSETLKYLVTNAWDRVNLLEDEDQIAGSINVFWTGSHHRSSVAVQVSTAQGTAVLSDAMFYEENVTEPHPIGINESMEECLAAYERIGRVADIILPLYDPRNQDRLTAFKAE